MTDKAHDKPKASGHSKAFDEGPHGNPAAASTSGLDAQGEFRISANYTLAVRGEGLVLRQAHSGREVEVSEAEFEGRIKETYFAD